jgi:hypothetical protein
MFRIIILLTVLLLPAVSNGQDTLSIPLKKKFHIERVRILISANYTFYNPVINQKEIFQGEFKANEDSAAVWVDRNNIYNLSKYLPIRNFQMTLQGNFWKGLYVGFHYQFFTIKNYKQDPVGGNLLSKRNAMFFLVGASFGYAFDFLKNKNLQIMPSMRIGSYSADDYYDAKGKKIYVGADCKFRYYIKNKFGFTLGVDYDFLRFRSNTYSDLFQRPSYKKVTFNNIHMNAGICYNINIRIADK